MELKNLLGGEEPYNDKSVEVQISLVKDHRHMNSGHIKATGPGSKIEAIAQFLEAKASSGQSASDSTSFNRQVTVQDKPHYPGIKCKQGEGEPVIQDLSEKRCTITTPANQVAGRQGQHVSVPGQASQHCKFYPLAGFDGQHLQTDEPQTYEQKHQQSGKSALSLEERKVYQCDFDGCDKKYKRKFSLQRHQLTHSGQKPFKCKAEKCGKQFAERYLLTNHELIHTNQKLFKCKFENCEKGFNQRHYLKVHELTHAGYKPYKCHLLNCGKAFSRKYDLKMHESIHSGQKPYECKIKDCGKRFKTKQNMKRHEFIHSGQKPFSCRVGKCGKVFTTKQQMIRHEVTHRDQKPFNCQIEKCGKGFTTKQHLICDYRDQQT